MKLKKILLAVFLTVASACVVCGFGKENPLRVSAATLANTTSFTMEEGAAARIKTLTDENGNPVESNGLRFSAEISQAEYDALTAAGARFGVVIVAKDLAKNVAINEETVFGANPSFYFSNETTEGNGKIAMLHVANPACSNIDKDENIEICGSLVNIKTNNFTRSFIGRAYVAMPQTDESGEVTGYTYQFAPYYGSDVANNTRCIYYVAQRAVEEESEYASDLQKKYIDVFAQTTQFTNYNYRYTVVHHYIYNENGELKDYQHSEDVFAQLNSRVTAKPIEKPSDAKELKDINFIFDVKLSQENNKQSGLVYAAGMQTLHLYYEQAEIISEESKDETLETVLSDFLDVTKAQENFGVDTTNNGTWSAQPVEETDENGNQVQTGINLVTDNPSKEQKVILSQEFFAKLHAYGVETVTFSFYSQKNGSQISAYDMYKGNTDTKMPFTTTTDENGEERVTIKISDLLQNGVVGYGVRLDIHSSASSNIGNYVFKNVIFGFPTKTV